MAVEKTGDTRHEISETGLKSGQDRAVVLLDTLYERQKHTTTAVLDHVENRQISTGDFRKLGNLASSIEAVRIHGNLLKTKRQQMDESKVVWWQRQGLVLRGSAVRPRHGTVAETERDCSADLLSDLVGHSAVLRFECRSIERSL